MQDIIFIISGGPGANVQIDESVITKRKYHRGRLVREKWILGIYDTTNNKGYIQYVNNRTSQVLIPIIQNHVQAGSTIWTDQWRAYNNLRHLGYIHQTVNHSRHFRDPVTGVCTNHVEGYWSKLKQYLRRLGVIGSPFLPEYIDQFLWNDIYGGGSAPNRFNSLITHIAQRYP